MKDSSHVATYRKKHLRQGETIVAAAEGYIGKMMGSGKDTQHNGALVVTTKRVAFYRKGFLGEVHQDIPLDKITSVEQSSMLGHRVLRVHTSHDDLEFKTFQGEQYPAVVSAIEAGRTGHTPRSPAPASEGPLEALKKLGELRAAGIVTDAEFEAKKRDLLAKL